MKVHVVIPAFRVREQILDVIARVGPEVARIWVIDDKCPEGSGHLVESNSQDARVSVIFHEDNVGVGGATITGYVSAISSGADIVVKVDGDGQMFPEDIPRLIDPIIRGESDYTKGNRFDSLEHLKQMPAIRIFGNASLSLMTKLSSGYWTVNDPTNGFTAIHRSALEQIDLSKVSKGFFFESDLLFRLSLAGAVVRDVSIPARYGSESSNLRIGKALLEFPVKHARNYSKRIAYLYFLREWSIGSIELLAGWLLLITGSVIAISSFLEAVQQSQTTTAGQATFSSLAIILGFQLLLSFVNYDIQSEPRNPVSKF